MDSEILSAFHQTLWIVIGGVCLLTLPTLVVGIIVSILQAATQINEMSLTFILKLITLFLVLFTLLPWLLHRLIDMTQNLMYNLPQYLR
jgi:flagellar biosynthetic protein FliQ